MMKNKIVLTLFILHFILMLNSCFVSLPIANKDYAHLYSQKTFKIEPKYKVFHQTNTKTKLYLFIESDRLLFAKPINGDSLQSKLLVQYRLYPTAESSNLLDSASFVFKHIKPNANVNLIDSLVFPANLGSQYVLDLVIKDVNRKEEFEDIIYIDKTKNNNEQFFLLKQNGKIIYDQFNTELNQKIKLYAFDTTIKQLIVKGYNHEFPIAIPPFSSEHEINNFKPDTLYKLDQSHNGNFNLNINKTGYYYLQADTTLFTGIGFISYNETYPKFSSFDEMIGPLRYITTRNEFDELLVSKDTKQSIDKFWLELSGNKERARELIKQYYGRVQNANYYFTSYKQGWKTDRGMIYTVFGAPNFVTRNGNIESWTYGEQNNYRSLNFFFTKQDKSINNNDYKLERNPLFKDEWMQAVDVWRQGRVYNPYN